MKSSPLSMLIHLRRSSWKHQTMAHNRLQIYITVNCLFIFISVLVFALKDFSNSIHFTKKKRREKPLKLDSLIAWLSIHSFYNLITSDCFHCDCKCTAAGPLLAEWSKCQSLIKLFSLKQTTNLTVTNHVHQSNEKQKRTSFDWKPSINFDHWIFLCFL